MATKDKSFEELVKEAPEAPAASNVSFVGTLAKSHEPGKFVLTLQEGNAVSFSIADVKSHTVLGSSVGQTIVRIEIEAAKAAELNPQPLPPGFGTQGLMQTLAAADILHTIPLWDHPGTPVYLDQGGTPVYLDQGGTSVYLDQGGTSVYLDQGGTSVYLDHGGTSVYLDQVGTGIAEQIGPNTLAEGPDPYGGYGQGQFGGVSPFALATPHQAPSGALTQLQLPYGTSVYLDQGGTSVYLDQGGTSVYLDQGGTPVYLDHGGGNTIYWRDHKLPSQDKRPQEDGTFPGHPQSDF